ncbi:MAG: hypothetical protein QXW52_09215 [Candidatus Caldarchaeum sp.]
MGGSIREKTSPTIATTSLEPHKSFYAKVDSDYRIYIPRHFRENVVRINPGDVLWLVVGTVIREQERLILP